MNEPLRRDAFFHFLCLGLVVGACVLACEAGAPPALVLLALSVVVGGLLVGVYGGMFDPSSTQSGGADSARLHLEQSTIFVSVASYRDTQCRQTIQSILSSAAHPERVVIGVCEQNAADDESCVVSAVQRGQIRQISIPYTAARGPCYARYLCSTLHRGEDLFLQVDSHSAFVQDWDVRLVDMFNRVPYDLDRFVLTHYPVDCSDARVVAELTDQHVPVINECRILDNHQLSFIAGASNAPHVGFYTSLSVGGGFLAMHQSVLANCPYDPELEGVFNMEEVVQAARFFTHGIHILSPSCNLVCHKYTYETHKVPWNEAAPTWDKGKDGTERCFQLLDGRLTDPVYGLGTARTIDDFWAYAGIDYRTKTTTRFEPMRVSPSSH